MKKQNNKGFTLIELLVAITVLAIVITPLLHSFVSSHRVNAKSKQLMRATTLAQNEMEIFEKEKIEDLIAMTDKSDPSKKMYAVTVPDLTNPASDGKYVFKRSGIINDESGREMFDVVVTLNPERENTSDRYYDENTKELLYMNTISNLDSGSFVQTIRSANNMVDYDQMVYGIYNVNKLPDGVGKTWTTDTFEEKLERNITIQITQLPDGADYITKAKITYKYGCEYGVMPDEYRYYTEEKVMFDNAQSFDDDGKHTPLKSLYLFYAPRYDTPKEDVITVINEANVPVNIYIIRQDIWEKTADTVRAVPASYQPKLVIKESLDGEGKTYGNYWTNLNLNDAEIEGNGKKLALSLVDKDNPSRIFSDTEVRNATQIKELGSTEVKDRIYTMEVAVYKKDADIAVDTPLVTMTGSKLE